MLEHLTSRLSETSTPRDAVEAAADMPDVVTYLPKQTQSSSAVRHEDAAQQGAPPPGTTNAGAPANTDAIPYSRTLERRSPDDCAPPAARHADAGQVQAGPALSEGCFGALEATESLTDMPNAQQVHVGSVVHLRDLQRCPTLNGRAGLVQARLLGDRFAIRVAGEDKSVSVASNKLLVPSHVAADTTSGAPRLWQSMGEPGRCRQASKADSAPRHAGHGEKGGPAARLTGREAAMPDTAKSLASVELAWHDPCPVSTGYVADGRVYAAGPAGQHAFPVADVAVPAHRDLVSCGRSLPLPQAVDTCSDGAPRSSWRSSAEEEPFDPAYCVFCDGPATAGICEDCERGKRI